MKQEVWSKKLGVKSRKSEVKRVKNKEYGVKSCRQSGAGRPKLSSHTKVATGSVKILPSITADVRPERGSVISATMPSCIGAYQK